MRNYEDSDSSSFNTYRSGNENQRRENSMNSDLTNNQINRQGSNERTTGPFNQNSPDYHSNDFRPNNQNQSYQSPYPSYRPQNMEQSSGRQNSWPQDYRQYYNQYGNHSQDRDYNQHRSGGRDFYENNGDRINEPWNRWNENQNQQTNWNNEQQSRPNQNQGYNQYNQPNNQHRYSSDYGHQNQTNQGRGYDENRYANRRNRYSDSNYRPENEGVFDRMGRYISNAWNNITNEEREDQDSGYRYNQGYHPKAGNRPGNQSNESNYNRPPYHNNSSFDRDQEW